MMYYSALKQIFVEFWEEKVSYLPREILSQGLLKSDLSFVITGPRQVGKSTYLYELRDWFTKNGFPEHNIAYVNFEDTRLIGFTHKDFDQILDAFLELSDEKKPIFFFDEIQNIEHWHRYVRSLVDKGYRVLVTGSNAHLLSSEIATHLAGRAISITLYPFSFKEICQFNKVDLSNKKLLFYGDSQQNIKALFSEYFEFGGIPSTVKLNERADKKSYLLSYYNTVFYRDLIARWKIENKPALQNMVKKIYENLGKSFSINSLFNLLKNIGIHLSKNTIYSYIDHLETIYLNISLHNYAASLKKREFEKKYYFIDNGIVHLFEITESFSKKLENLVFLELLKHNYNIFFMKNGYECDFVLSLENKLNITHALQVCYKLTEYNRQREINGLIAACKEFNLTKGTIITFYQEETITEENINISIIPAWKWCLNLDKMLPYA